MEETPKYPQTTAASRFHLTCVFWCMAHCLSQPSHAGYGLLILLLVAFVVPSVAALLSEPARSYDAISEEADDPGCTNVTNSSTNRTSCTEEEEEGWDMDDIVVLVVFGGFGGVVAAVVYAYNTQNARASAKTPPRSLFSTSVHPMPPRDTEEVRVNCCELVSDAVVVVVGSAQTESNVPMEPTADPARQLETPSAQHSSTSATSAGPATASN